MQVLSETTCSLVGICKYDGQAFHKNNKKDLVKEKKCKEKGIKLIRIREKECADLENTSSLIFKYEYGDYDELNKIIHEILKNINNVDVDIDIENKQIDIQNQYIIKKKKNSVSSKYPHLVSEWDYEKNLNITPEMVGYGTNKKFWWKCKMGHSYISSVANRTVSGNNCPYCSRQKLLVGFNDLQTCHPEIANEWDYKKNNPLKPTDVIGGAKKVWWICPQGHSYQTSINSRTNSNHSSGCPFCSGQKTLSGYNDFETWCKDNSKEKLLQEWNFEKNTVQTNRISSHSNKKVWWNCSRGHLYEMSIYNRIIGQGCPVCVGKRVIIGVNDLKTTNPMVAQEWDYDKNETTPEMFTSGSGKKVWWRCSQGHSYSTVICWKVSDQSGCPICANKIVLRGYNDLKTKNPILASEWDYDKNTFEPTEVVAGSSKSVWWKCNECNFSWKASISSRHNNGHGCPKCGRAKIKKSKYKKIRNLDTNEIFNSISEAEKKYSKANISKCLRGESKTAGGCRWEYLKVIREDLE